MKIYTSLVKYSVSPSLHYALGARQAGKTTALVNWVVEQAAKEPCGVYIFTPIGQQGKLLRERLRDQGITFTTIIDSTSGRARGWSIANMSKKIAIVDDIHLFKDINRLNSELGQLNPQEIMISKSI